jgi:hypothetical protein
LRTAGTLWFGFRLFGMDWQVRVANHTHKVLKDGKHECQGICFFNSRTIVLSQRQTHEQMRVTFAHELQHAIEESADVDYEKGVKTEVHDRWTDQVARGWVYMMRHHPEVIEFLQGKQWPGQKKKKD